METPQKGTERFGQYLVLDRIGDGGMAEIFLAKMQGYSGFEKLVALKKILPRYSQNPTFARMLIHEGKLAAQLQHFNVVQVLDLGEIEGQVYIAMEYVRGRDLAALLSNTYRRKERLAVPLSLCIATEFLTGLDYAHRLQDSEGRSLGLVHRDISPQNVLISFEGEVKLTDFGIARVIVPDGQKIPGNLHGKFGYMSPEQIRGHTLDQRSDVFSAGVVIHEMLTGQRLFRGKHPEATAELILNARIEPPSFLHKEVSPEIDQICARALARDRDERYQTVGALLGDLSRVASRHADRAHRRELAVYMRRHFGRRSGRPTEHRVGGPEIQQVSAYSPTPGERVPLGEILITLGALTLRELDIALAEQRARGGRLGQILLETSVITEEELVVALAKQSGLSSIGRDELLDRRAPEAVLARFPRDVAEATLAIPIASRDSPFGIELASAEPFDQRALLEAKIVLGVSNIVVRVTPLTALRTAVAQWFDGEPSDAPQPAAPLIFEDPIEATPRPLGPAQVSDDRGLVLIADSSSEAAESLADRLREEDLEVQALSDGKAVRGLIRRRSPSVVVVDAALPAIDGYNLLLELRSRGSSAAVFITSARPGEFQEAKALELGADHFVAKPWSLEVLTSKIRREISKRSHAAPFSPPPVEFNGVSGSLEVMTLIDIVQSLELASKTADIVIQYEDGRSGEIGVVSGDVRGASSGDALEEEAFYALARPGPGLFRIEYRTPSVASNIRASNQALLLETLRRLDREGIDIQPRKSSQRVTRRRSPFDLTSDLALGTPPPANRTPSEGGRASELGPTSVTPHPDSQALARVNLRRVAATSKSAEAGCDDGDKKNRGS